MEGDAEVLPGLGRGDSGGRPFTEAVATQGNYAGGAMLKTIGREPTIAERLDDEIARTEQRLKDMKAAREAIDALPGIETLHKGLAAMNRNRY